MIYGFRIDVQGRALRDRLRARATSVRRIADAEALAVIERGPWNIPAVAGVPAWRDLEMGAVTGPEYDERRQYAAGVHGALRRQAEEHAAATAAALRRDAEALAELLEFAAAGIDPAETYRIPLAEILQHLAPRAALPTPGAPR
jgi:hypothetical protein